MKQRYLQVACGFLFVAALAEMTAFAGDAKTANGVERIEIEVAGLACPFCAKGLEMRLEKVDRVAEADTDLANGVAHIQFDTADPPEFAALWNAVKESGFTPAALRIEMLGTLARSGDGIELRAVPPSRPLAIPLAVDEKSLDALFDQQKPVRLVAVADFSKSEAFVLESAQSSPDGTISDREK